jgi:hypothetical protein
VQTGGETNDVTIRHSGGVFDEEYRARRVPKAMSRGIGRLQRRLLAELENGRSTLWALCVQMFGTVSDSQYSASRRAMIGLISRGLVKWGPPTRCVGRCQHPTSQRLFHELGCRFVASINAARALSRSASARSASARSRSDGEPPLSAICASRVAIVR